MIGVIMLMKVFNKGQVVIPAGVRKTLGINVGDLLDVSIDEKKHKIEMKPHTTSIAESLAGSLSRFKGNKKFPSKKEMHEFLRKGMSNDFTTD